MIKKFTVLFNVTLLFVIFTTSGLFASEQTVAESIADAVIEKVSHITAYDIYDLMEAQYKKLNLIDENGVWTIYEMEQYGDYLLPDMLTMAEMNDFVYTMAHHFNENPYASSFLDVAVGNDYPALIEKFDNEGASILPNILAYAQVLNRLTVVMYNDNSLLQPIDEHFKVIRSNKKLLKNFTFFLKAKLYSVAIPVSGYVKYFADNHVPTYKPRLTLPLNIMEATLVDFFAGRKDNAFAGWVLAKNRSGNKYNPETGADKPRISEDGTAVEYRMPFPKEWADLYSTWNMAFVSKYENFPYFYTKLMIPQVANYKNKPSQYIYNRALALYIHLHHMLITRGENVENGTKDFNWMNEDLMNDWGAENKISAKEYKSLF